MRLKSPAISVGWFCYGCPRAIVYGWDGLACQTVLIRAGDWWLQVVVSEAVSTRVLLTPWFKWHVPPLEPLTSIVDTTS